MAEVNFKIVFFLLALVPSFCIAASQGPSQALTQEMMEAAVRRQVLAEGPWKPQNVEVRVLPFQPISVPGGPVTYRILKPSKGITPGLQNLLVAAEVAGKEAARFWIKSEIRVFDEVLVTSYPLAHHETVTADKVRLERRDVSSVAARPFSRLEEALGLQATRVIEVNEVLTQKSLERPMLMRRGSPIVLVYESGSLHIETPGYAEEGGKAGDLIQVKNASSGKLLRGVVLDQRTVRVN